MALRLYIALASCLTLGLVQCQPVNQPPVLKEAPKEVLYVAQKQFELECLVESGDASQLKYEWHKDNKIVQPSSEIEQKGSKLIFKNPKNEDEGIYSCLATSPAGVASTRSISVKRMYLNAPNKVTVQKLQPVEGKHLKLACPIPNAYPVPTIDWKKQYSGGRSENISDGRTTVSPLGDLTFTNATEKDVGKDYTYVCVATSPAVDGEVKLAEYSVESLEKNPKPDHEAVQVYVTPDQHKLTLGEPAYLYCIYGSSPQAYPDWFKDGVNVNNKPSDRVTRHNRSKGKRLLIKNVLPEDQGLYTCVINNELGKEQKYSFHVNVVSPPKFSQKPEKRTQVKEGGDLFIPCEVTSIPPGTTTWSYNAQPLSNTRATFNNKGLTIKKLQKSDGGYYGCLSNNELGVEYAETLVQVA